MLFRSKQVLIAQYGSNGVGEGPAQRIANAFVANFEDPMRCTDVIDDTGKARSFIAGQSGAAWPWQLAKGAVGVAREQARQAFGGAPRHPLA